LIYNYLVDTDVLIWYLRGNPKAKELLKELRVLQKFIKLWRIKIIYIDENISVKALNSIEEYFLSNSLKIADTFATALKSGVILVTANNKHYRVFKDLEMKVFRA
jgi:predicted nucleic acid-binding protein